MLLFTLLHSMATLTITEMSSRTISMTKSPRPTRGSASKTRGTHHPKINFEARWDNMFKMQNDFMAQLGGFRKILADNNLKEKPPVPSTKQRDAGKENRQEQNSGD